MTEKIIEYGSITRFADNKFNSNAYILNENKLIIDPSKMLNKSYKNHNIILTHIHHDHFSKNNLKGIVYFSKDGLKKLLDKDYFIKEMIFDKLGIVPKKRLNQMKLMSLVVKKLLSDINDSLDIRLLDFSNNECLNLGGIKVYSGKGHTNDSILIEYENNNLKYLFQGYAYNELSYKTWEGDFNESLKTVDRIIKLSPDAIMPGHGEPLFGKEKIVENFINLKKEALNEHEAIIQLCDNSKGITLIDILKKRNYEYHFVDGGLGLPYTIIKSLHKKGLIFIENSRIYLK